MDCLPRRRKSSRLSGMLASTSLAAPSGRPAYITTQRRFPMKQALRLTPVLAALGLAAGLACAAGAQAQSIKIAVVGPTTGPVTQYGAMVREGVDTAVERINAAGGIDGKKLETVVIDDGCEPKQGPDRKSTRLNSS